MIYLGEILVFVSNAIFATIDFASRVLGGVSVSEITTEELQQIQVEGTAPHHRSEDKMTSSVSFVLVDVRTESESSVSMIPGAITRQQYETSESRYRSRLVIPYCTVGGRSYLYARKLAKAGIETRNYKSSVLGWCKACLPLVGPDGEPTTRVHVYSSVFKVPGGYQATGT